MIEGKNLLVVAHPDDETLFACTQLQNPNLVVVCMTGKSNAVRSSEFHAVMNKYKLEHVMFDLKDEWGIVFNEDEVISNISPILSMKFDNIITHNEQGEYGHSQHISLHTIIHNVVDNNLWTFGHLDGLLCFNLLRDKITTLLEYESQCNLNAWDWYDSTNSTNKLMNYVTQEGFRRIK